MKRKPLFRMTKKRAILLDRIITHINIRYEHVVGFSRMLIEEYKDEVKKKVAQVKNVEEEKKWALVLDVLHTVSCHNQPFYLNLHFKENRGWLNEWDVPTETFREAFVHAMELLEWYQERSHRQEPKDKHEEKIHLLQTILDFRLAE